jgi:hypothetical protein
MTLPSSASSSAVKSRACIWTTDAFYSLEPARLARAVLGGGGVYASFLCKKKKKRTALYALSGKHFKSCVLRFGHYYNFYYRKFRAFFDVFSR